MLSEWGFEAGPVEGVWDALAVENGGFLPTLSEKLASVVQATGVAGPEANTIEILLIVTASVLILGLVINIGSRTTRALKRKSPEKLASELLDNHVAFVDKFVDEMQLALSTGPSGSPLNEGPMKALMDKSEATWEQVAALGQEDPAIERAFCAYLNSLKRLSVMEKAVLARTEIAELDTSDFEFQHPIAEAAAGLRVLSRALGKSGTSKKDRLARYELTALSEDAEVIWDELKARADAQDLNPDIVLRSQSNFDQTDPGLDLQDKPLPHIEDIAEPEIDQAETATAQPQVSIAANSVQSKPDQDGVVTSGALSGYEIVDDGNRRARRRRRRR